MTKFLSDTDKDFIWNNSSNTLSLMTDYEVVPNPQNYHLWYTHSANSDLNLSKVINSMITNKKDFNDELNEKLYEKFFSTEQEVRAIAETGATFQKELTKIVTVLKDAGEDSSEHTKTLLEQMDKLSDFKGSNELINIVKVIVSDTAKINEQSKKLEVKLEESTVKIQGLQSNLENARLESRTDALTNIGNRKFFEEKMSEYLDNFKKNGEDFCLILCDIDFFKKFNDNYGHLVGDQVLKVVAHIIKVELGLLGSAARYGGEEFAILLPKLRLEEGVKLAEKIRRVLSHRTIKNKNTGEYFGKITMSFGVATAHNGTTIDDLIQRSDSALYLAKCNGRNMVQSELQLDQVIKSSA